MLYYDKVGDFTIDAKYGGEIEFPIPRCIR